MKRSKAGKLSPAAVAFLIILPVIGAVIALCAGRLFISPAEIIESLVAKLDITQATSGRNDIVIWGFRFPRIILALLVGAGLSVSGTAFQGLFANPLATPDTLGVASGSGFGAALALLFGAGTIGVQSMSLLFGLVAVLLTFLSGSGRGKGVGRFVLSGIMIGSLFTALISLVKFVADTESQLPAITYWLMGSLGSAGFEQLAVGAPLIVVGMVVLLLLRWRLNLLPLSDDEAKASGVNIKILRIVTVICATMITASCVSMCGQVGWVGLLIPHLCRLLFGNNNLSLVPASASLGATFMVLVDTLARSATAAEIPVSILTAIIGAPVFIVLMRRRDGWSL